MDSPELKEMREAYDQVIFAIKREYPYWRPLPFRWWVRLHTTRSELERQKRTIK
jgi:hypothetical protein